MTKILLTRHGHVEGILPERFRGRAELALTKKGVAEAEALAARIARAWRPAVVYTSALQRCVVTGTIIANLCGAKAIPLEGLMDIVGVAANGDYVNKNQNTVLRFMSVVLLVTAVSWLLLCRRGG